jgi:hypothetical protein
MEIDRAGHQMFLEIRGEHLLGRRQIERQVAQLIADDVSEPVVLCAEAGAGKSALMAACANNEIKAQHQLAINTAKNGSGGAGKSGKLGGNGASSQLSLLGGGGGQDPATAATEFHKQQGLLRQPTKDHVFYHFVGASPGSTDVYRLLTRLWYEISPSGEQPPSSLPQLIRGMPRVMAEAGKHARTVIFIDALNQLDTDDNAQTLNWLPLAIPPGYLMAWHLARLMLIPASARTSFVLFFFVLTISFLLFCVCLLLDAGVFLLLLNNPPGVVCVVSMIDGSDTHVALMARPQVPREIKVRPLDIFSRSEIVATRLWKCGKKLHPSQTNALLAKTGSSNPLWLITA